MSFVPSSWTDLTHKTEGTIEAIKLCKINSQSSSSSQPPIITHSLRVNADLSWKLTVHGHEVTPTSTTLLSNIPEHINASTIMNLLSILEKCSICPGNCDERFVDMVNAHKGKLLARSGEVRAYCESGFPVSCGGSVVSTTVRTSACPIITPQGRCSLCNDYRKQLRMSHSRWIKKTQDSPQKFANDRFLTTPQRKKKMKSLQTRAVTEQEVIRLRGRIEKSTSTNGVMVDVPLHESLNSIMSEHNDSIEKQFPEGTFRPLFWEEQIKAAKATNARQMRWHPMMIKGCLILKLLSTSAYYSLRTSGFVKLPSERTLRDYTHFFKSKEGYQQEVDLMLKQEASLHGSSESNSYVCIIFDEVPDVR